MAVRVLLREDAPAVARLRMPLVWFSRFRTVTGTVNSGPSSQGEVALDRRVEVDLALGGQPEDDGRRSAPWW
ncbi:hypothetical protein SALBM217S_01491 [Streptomyces griseoloalbus]